MGDIQTAALGAVAGATMLLVLPLGRLSHATTAIRRGRGFAVHEALDQIGAILEPLVVTGVLVLPGGLRWIGHASAQPQQQAQHGDAGHRETSSAGR